MKIVLSPNTYASVAFAFVVFIFSMILLPYASLGDQIHYRAFYEELPGYTFTDGFGLYQAVLGTQEWGYYILVYFSSGWWEKDFAISVLNAMLGGVLVRFILSLGASGFLLLMILFNFYFLVLLFSAERLKLGMLFCVLAFSTQGGKGFIYWLMAFLSHAQILILLLVKLFSRMASDVVFMLQGRLKYSLLISAGIGVVFFVVIFTVLGDHIAAKLDAYSGPDSVFASGWQALLKPAVFLMGSAFYAKQSRYEAIVAHIPIFVAAFFVGDERLVMFSYFIFMYYAIQVKKGLNVGVLVSSFYFFIKGVFFILNIVEYGDGFYGG